MLCLFRVNGGGDVSESLYWSIVYMCQIPQVDVTQCALILLCSTCTYYTHTAALTDIQPINAIDKTQFSILVPISQCMYVQHLDE